MSNIFLTVAAISGGVALGGYVWSSVVRLRSRKEAAVAGEESQKGAELRTGDATVTDGVIAPPVGESAVEAQTSILLAGIGRQIRKEGWRRALPGLLAAGGMLTLLVSIALALLASLPSKVFGLFALGVAVYIAVTELRSCWRALRD